MEELPPGDQTPLAEHAGERERRGAAEQRAVKVEEGGRSHAERRSADERQRLDDAAALAAKRLDLLRDRHDRLGRLSLRLRRDDRRAGIALLPQRRIERNRAEQRYAEILRELLPASAAED